MNESRNLVLNSLGYKVLTPSGYQEFSGVAYMGDKLVFRIEFGDDVYLETTGHHKLFNLDGSIVYSEDLKPGDKVLAQRGHEATVTSVVNTGRIEPVYDLIDVNGGHRYFTNGILSSNCDFVSDDETLIDALTLSYMKSVEPEFYTGQVRWFKEPEPNKTYLVGLDPSLGTGGDYSAIQVFELPGMVQVGEWQHNKTPPRGQIIILLKILQAIDQEMRSNPNQSGEPIIYWTVENNSIGEAVLQVIEDTGEHNFPGTMISEKRKPGAGRRHRKGLTTTNSNKLNACAKFKSLTESGRLKLNSRALIKQLKSFVSNGASYAGKGGEPDDLVMATMLIIRMLETVIHWLGFEEAEELNEAIDPEDNSNTPLPIMLN